MTAQFNPELTGNQRDVLELVAAGKTNGEIASILGVSETCVRQRLERAMRKLDANNRTLAAVKFLKLR